MSDDVKEGDPHVKRLKKTGKLYYRRQKHLNVTHEFTDEERLLMPHWLHEKGLFKINPDKGASLYGN